MWVVWTFFSLMCSHSSLSHKLFVSIITQVYPKYLLLLKLPGMCKTRKNVPNWHLSAHNQKHVRPLTKKMWEYLFWGHHRVRCSDYQRLKLLKDQCLLTLSAEGWESWRWAVGGVVGVNIGNTLDAAILPTAGFSGFLWRSARSLNHCVNSVKLFTFINSV